MTAPHELPDFHLLCGFLGSGKTSLVLDVLADEALANTGVIVNDVGEINIDGATISASRSGVPMAALSNGCVCCSLTSDLPMTVAALMDETEIRGAAPLRRIILETSGLSRPAPIVRQLLGLPVPFRLRVLSTYDCVNGALSSGQFEEAAAQVAGAQTVVLTKLDRVDATQAEDATDVVRAFNPLARIIEEPRGTARARAAFGSVETRVEVRIEDILARPAPRFEHERASVFLVRMPGAPDLQDMLEWLDNLAGYCGPRLLRVKGVIGVAGMDAPILVQSVGTVFDPPRCLPADTPAQNAIVVIARDLEAREIAAIPTDLRLAITERREATPLGRVPRDRILSA